MNPTSKSKIIREEENWKALYANQTGRLCLKA